MNSSRAVFLSWVKQSSISKAVSHYSNIIAIWRPTQAKNPAEINVFTSVCFGGQKLRTHLIVLGVGYLPAHTIWWKGLKFSKVNLRSSARQDLYLLYLLPLIPVLSLVRPEEVWFTDSHEKQTNFRITVLGLGFIGLEALGISEQNYIYVYRFVLVFFFLMWLCFYIWEFPPCLPPPTVLILESTSPTGYYNLLPY